MTEKTDAARKAAAAMRPVLGAGRYPITKEGLAALHARVARLRLAKDLEIADRLQQAREFGEPSANDEYMAIREEENVLEGRIRALEKLIDNATVIEVEPGRRGVVTLDSTVAVEDPRSGRVERLRVAEGPDAGRPGTVSAASPAGRALMGRPVGARVEVPIPGGRPRALVVRAITEPRVPSKA